MDSMFEKKTKNDEKQKKLYCVLKDIEESKNPYKFLLIQKMLEDIDKPKDIDDILRKTSRMDYVEERKKDEIETVEESNHDEEETDTSKKRQMRYDPRIDVPHFGKGGTKNQEKTEGITELETSADDIPTIEREERDANRIFDYDPEAAKKKQEELEASKKAIQEAKEARINTKKAKIIQLEGKLASCKKESERKRLQEQIDALESELKQLQPEKTKSDLGESKEP